MRAKARRCRRYNRGANMRRWISLLMQDTDPGRRQGRAQERSAGHERVHEERARRCQCEAGELAVTHILNNGKKTTGRSFGFVWRQRHRSLDDSFSRATRSLRSSASYPSSEPQISLAYAAIAAPRKPRAPLRSSRRADYEFAHAGRKESNRAEEHGTHPHSPTHLTSTNLLAKPQSSPRRTTRLPPPTKPSPIPHPRRRLRGASPSHPQPERSSRRWCSFADPRAAWSETEETAGDDVDFGCSGQEEEQELWQEHFCAESGGGADQCD